MPYARFVEVLLVIGLVGFVGFIYFVFRPGKYDNVQQWLLKTPLSRISDLVDGTEVRIAGRVELIGPPLIAPLTGRACVYFDAAVFDDRYRGRYITRYKDISEVNGISFMLNDGTARALIEASPTYMSLTYDMNATSGLFEPTSPVQRAFVERLGGTTPEGVAGLLNKQLHYREGVIHVGEVIAVMGVCTREPDPGAPGQTRIRMAGNSERGLLISDAPDTTLPGPPPPPSPLDDMPH